MYDPNDPFAAVEAAAEAAVVDDAYLDTLLDLEAATAALRDLEAA